MASDSIGRYLLANMAELIAAAQVIATFGFDLFTDDDRVGAPTTEEGILAGELLGLIADAEGEDPPLPQIGPLVWLTIAYQIAKLITSNFTKKGYPCTKRTYITGKNCR